MTDGKTAASLINRAFATVFLFVNCQRWEYNTITTVLLLFFDKNSKFFYTFFNLAKLANIFFTPAPSKSTVTS